MVPELRQLDKGRIAGTGALIDVCTGGDEQLGDRGTARDDGVINRVIEMFVGSANLDSFVLGQRGLAGARWAMIVNVRRGAIYAGYSDVEMTVQPTVRAAVAQRAMPLGLVAPPPE